MMKQHIITKILLMLLMSMVGKKALAYDIAVKNTDGITIYYNYINDGKELEVTSGGLYSYQGSVVIPDEVSYMNRTRKVTSIGNDTFNTCWNLTSVIIPNCMMRIGKQAFAGCDGLTSIIIPNNVTNIDVYAFAYCRSLTSITIPENVTNIEDGMFSYCI